MKFLEIFVYELISIYFLIIIIIYHKFRKLRLIDIIKFFIVKSFLIRVRVIDSMIRFIILIKINQ